MKIHPQVTHLNGVITVTLVPQFVQEATDADDAARISAYGDPQVNLGGSFSDGATPTPFTFVTGYLEVWVGLMTGMQYRAARFMTQLPTPQAGDPIPAQGPLDVITNDPVKAATLYASSIQARILAVMTTLRAKTPAKLTTLPDLTI